MGIYNPPFISPEKFEMSIEDLEKQLEEAHMEFQNAKLGSRKQMWLKRKRIAEELQKERDARKDKETEER
jgi:hypothetical protein